MSKDLEATAIVHAFDRADTQLEELTLPESTLLAAIDKSGMLGDIAGMTVLTEEGRYTKRVSRIVATLHGADGKPYRAHRWTCDGYGRIVGSNVEDLPSRKSK